MSISVRKINELKQWEKFYLKNSPAIFVQSLNYAEFMNNYGDKAQFWGVFDNDKLIGGSIVIHVHARRGDFLYLPYGPVLPWDNVHYFECFIKALQIYAREQHVVAIKISPFLEDNIQYKKFFKKYRFRKSPLHILAETTWILDIIPSEDELLKNMRKNHRYLIRRAGKDGVTITQSTDLKDIKIFINLHQETVSRHKFIPFSSKYIQMEFESFVKDDQSKVFLAYYQGRVISAAIIMFYGDTAVYRHGASSSEYRKIPSSYLILWEAIVEAKKRGIKYFNFWGIAPNKNPKHPFAGITLFKTGFGGKRYDLLPCQDLPVSKSYWISWAVDRVRKFRRGF